MSEFKMGKEVQLQLLRLTLIVHAEQAVKTETESISVSADQTEAAVLTVNRDSVCSAPETTAGSLTYAYKDCLML